jgi:hypothetical protein
MTPGELPLDGQGWVGELPNSASPPPPSVAPLELILSPQALPAAGAAALLRHPGDGVALILRGVAIVYIPLCTAIRDSDLLCDCVCVCVCVCDRR